MSETANPVNSPATSASALTIQDVHRAIGAQLHIPPEDRDMIDFTLAVYKSNEMPGDPLWGMIVDASGGGKTELLRSLRKRPDASFLSKLTDKSLVSGYRAPRHPKNDPSLLPKLHGKVLIIKDLSPLLSMRRESRNQILGDLRDAYDGFSDQAWGNIGCVGYESRFTFLGATTLAVERYDSVEQELGERCIKFRARSNETTGKVRRAIGNTGSDDTLREDIAKAINGFLDSLLLLKPAQLSSDGADKLTAIADFVASARSYVPRDRNHGLRYVPRPEVGTRLGKELAKLYVALAHVRGKAQPDGEDLRTVCRVAEDCLPPNRLTALRVLYASQVPLETAKVAGLVKLPRNTARNALEDLAVLGIVEKSVSESLDATDFWQLSADRRKQVENVALLH